MKSKKYSLDLKTIRKSQSCSVILERIKIPALTSRNIIPKGDRNFSSSSNGATSIKLTNNLKKLKHITRPCHVLLKRYRPSNGFIKPVRNKLKLRCAVMLEKLRHVEIEITTQANGFREVYYTLESTAVNADTSGFEDYRVENFKALSPRKSIEEIRNVKKSKRECKDKNLFLRLPMKASFVFKVNNIKGRLPFILPVLSGDKMEASVLDAYLILELESFNEKSVPQSPSSSSKNFQYLSILYFPIYKEKEFFAYFSVPDRKYSPKRIEESTILVAPQLACQHFYLAIYDFPSRIVHVYDSSWKFVRLDLRFKQVQTVLKFLLKNNPHLNQSWDQWSVNFLEKCAQQRDEVNCGCYVIYFTRNLLNRKTTSETNLRELKNAEMVEIRRDIVRKLLETTKLGLQILNAISE